MSLSSAAITISNIYTEDVNTVYDMSCLPVEKFHWSTTNIDLEISVHAWFGQCCHLCRIDTESLCLMHTMDVLSNNPWVWENKTLSQPQEQRSSHQPTYFSSFQATLDSMESALVEPENINLEFSKLYFLVCTITTELTSFKEGFKLALNWPISSFYTKN